MYYPAIKHISIEALHSTAQPSAAQHRHPRTMIASATATAAASSSSSSSGNNEKKKTTNYQKSIKARKTSSAGASAADKLREKTAAYVRKCVAEQFLEGTAVVDTVLQNFPAFRFQDLTLGKVLGKGGFCTVHEIRAFSVVVEEGNGSDNPAAATTTTTPLSSDGRSKQRQSIARDESAGQSFWY